MKVERTMAAKQISVFLENRPGKLAEFVDLLRGHGIDMRALSLAEAATTKTVKAAATMLTA